MRYARWLFLLAVGETLVEVTNAKLDRRWDRRARTRR